MTRYCEGGDLNSYIENHFKKSVTYIDEKVFFLNKIIFFR